MFKLIERTTLRLTLLATMVFMVGTSVSCTKKSESSTLNIEMPNWSAVTQGKAGALSGTKVTAVTRVMINISGPGMPTAVRIWDFNDAPRVANVLPLPPAEFSFEVPRGSDRLFQALAILEEVDLSSSENDGGNGAITFLYGDVTKSVSQSIEAVPIALVNQGTANGADGSLSGRYLTSTGVGPSGKVNMYYAPPNGRPEMIVQTTSIFSGFMHFFVPPTAQFSYRMAESKLPLFEKITLSSFDSLISTKLLRIEVPAAFQSRGGGTREPTRARSKLIGFFGPGAASEVVCYNSYADSLSNLYVTDNLANLTGVEWAAGSNSVTDARRIGGGQPYTGEMCPGGYGDFGVGHLFPRIKSLANGDSPLGLYGPFQELSPSSNSFLTASFNGTQLSLYWKYLKPTIGDSVDGVGVFTKTLAATESADLRWHDSAPCSNLTSLGFSEVTRVAAGTQASPVETYTIAAVNGSAYTSGRLVTALCPYSNTKGYYDFAVTHSSGSSHHNTATQMVLTRLGEPGVSSSGVPTKVSSGACTPMKLRTTDAYGNPARKLANGSSMDITQVGGGSTQFSLDPSCSAPSSTIGFNMYDSEYVFYVVTDPAATAFEIRAQDYGGSPLPTAIFYAVRSVPVTASRAIANAPMTVYQYQCFPFFTSKASVDGADRVPEGDSGGQTIGYSSSLSQSGLSFFTDGACDAPAGALAYTSDILTASKKVYARYTGPLSTISLAPTVAGLTTETISINIIPPGPAVRTQLSIAAQVNPSSCVSVKLHSQDLQGRSSPVTATSTTNFSFSSTPVGQSGMFSDPSCTVPVTSAAISANQTSSSTFYFRWDTQETMVISSGTGSTLPLYPSTVLVSP